MKKILLMLFFLLCITTITEAEELSNYPIWKEYEQIVGKTDGSAVYYTITLEQDQRVTFTFQHIGDAKLQIWTSDDQAITISIKDLDSDSSSHYVDLRAGTYKVSIRDASVTNKPVDYAISYKLSDVGSYDLEKNNSIEQANRIPLNTRIVGNLDSDFYSTDDYYRIDIPNRSILTLQTDVLFNSKENANLVGFTLYDKDLQIIGRVNSSYRFDSSIKQFVDAGTYYVKVDVSNANESTIDYAFTISAEKVDPTLLTETGKNVNDKNAMNLPFNQLLHGFFYSDWGYSNTHDYFKIHVPKDGTIQIKYDPELIGGHLRLQGDNNFHVLKGNYKEKTPTILETKIKAGTYDLEAFASLYFEGFSPYTLVVRMQSFTDVPFSHLYYEQIETIKNRNIITGYPDGTFNPNGVIKREHVFKMLAAVDEITFSKVRTATEFSDVSVTNPYYEQIKLMYETGIIDGDQGKMNPKSSLTRAQLAKILVNAFDLKLNGKVKNFSDVSPSDWSYTYIQILASNGITTGSNGKFLPNEPVTRQHFALFLARCLESLE
ncbi:S-layer homology domain-containing protein [Peribacillus loiseleuriae]|uniref:S-layer homology domain-containing protein n=1 Tax=Peribacillus loiseleuriae TaxID=1679170 RepID=UPI003CFE4BEE